MSVIRANGLDVALRDFHSSGRPLLGICIGAQIAFDRSEEDDATCLGLLPGAVRLHPGRDDNGITLKVPHMGWNPVHQVAQHPVFGGIAEGTPFYFVHSYYAVPARARDVLGSVEYGIVMPAVVGNRNLVATQFHLEKSGPAGLTMLSNFLGWDGTWDKPGDHGPC
jgi:glutamine amidotransferase